MKLNKTIKIVMILLLLPISIMADTAENAQKAMEFMQGGSIIEDWFMEDFIGGYREILMEDTEIYVDIAKAIAGIFALLYFATVAWNMMTGDKELKIIPLLKPFGILMIILNWSLFIGVITTPFKYMADTAHTQYQKSVDLNSDLRLSRHRYQMAVLDALVDVQADNDVATEAVDKSFWESVGDMGQSAIDLIVKPIYAFKAKINASLQNIITQLLELIGLWILRIAVYVLFTMQMVYSAVLIFLGPISVAFSILPTYANAFKHWLSRYITVQFYLIVAFIVLQVSSALTATAYQQEINRYSDMINIDGTVKSADMLIGFAMNGITTFGIVIITFIVSAIAILAVPKISGWIIPSGGTSGMVTGASRSVSMAMMGGARLF